MWKLNWGDLEIKGDDVKDNLDKEEASFNILQGMKLNFYEEGNEKQHKH